MAQISDLRRRFRNTLNRTSQAFIRTETLNTSGTTFSIDTVDDSADTFIISGDVKSDPNLAPNYHIWIWKSSANNAIFQIDSVTVNGNGNTEILVKESIKKSSSGGQIVVDKNYDYKNFGRVKETSIETDVVSSDMDQDGRTSSNLLEFTVSMTLQQAANEELSIVSQLDRPPRGGHENAQNVLNPPDPALYPREYDFYPNGHFVYFSGDQSVTTTQVDNAVNVTNDTRQDGELLTQTKPVNLPGSPSSGIRQDVNGLLFQDVILNTGPSLDLSGGQNVISIEFGGTVHFDQLDSLDGDRKISMSPSDFFSYV